ncbi:MAG TPA: universal stress protein [Aldersonia sp.]
MSSTESRHGIVAGIDGSPSAVDAACWAATAAARLGEPLRLVHVRPAGDTADPDGTAALDEAEQAVRKSQPDLQIERVTDTGPPARVLVDYSKSVRMLVLGRTGTSEMRSMFVGSDVVRVTNHAHCPVVVWRGERSPEHDRRPVVVGVDGSELSGTAVAQAYEFASMLRVGLIAVHAWSEQSSLGYGESRRFVDWKGHEAHESAVLSEMLSGWADKFPDVEVTRHVERGSARGALLRHSEQAQLVAVGSHGRNPVLAAMLGSTTQNLLHHAVCPILICRREPNENSHRT